ncbi:hypothetical protein EMIT0210MI2_70016 [Priestia megaterium]
MMCNQLFFRMKPKYTLNYTKSFSIFAKDIHISLKNEHTNSEM